MNLRFILEPDALAEEQHCKRKLSMLRALRSRAADALLQMCCELQKDPDSLDPERISAVLAEVKYLEGRAQQLERLLSIVRKAGGGEVDV